MTIRIHTPGGDPVVAFAVEELAKYLKLLDPASEIMLCLGRRYGEDENALFVGLDPALVERLPKVLDAELDDAVFIDVRACAGVVTGANARSVLLAVYRLLSENGCAWARMGPDGEIIPKRQAVLISADVCEKPSCRHRAVCIEGAVSAEHVKNMIEWLPKVGMNGYFRQFVVPYHFYERWYSHSSNPTLEPVPFTKEDAISLDAAIEEEIKKRGLLYHAVGHGWTCEPFGIEGISWKKSETELPDEVRDCLAMVNGERGLWKGVAMNTNLCYSNEKVRGMVTNAIADYCKENAQVKYLHFWLADGSNNNCECENCRDTHPSDYYVMMLNELDRELTRRGLDTKVVFLIYVDLLFAPEKEKIENPDRFVLMFAPITRTYSKTFTGATAGELPEPKPYVRNKCEFPKSVSENLAYLRAWQRIFNGDSFDFDYHFMWDHFCDPGYYAMAKVLFEDMKSLPSIGLNGMVSCQNQRVFLPTGLPMYLMARGLWDSGADFKTCADEYFKGAFGLHGAEAREYLAELSSLFTPEYIRCEAGAVNPEAAAKYAAVPALVESFASVIADAIDEEEDENVKKSWKYLAVHGKYAALLSRSFGAAASGDFKRALSLWEHARVYINELELELTNVFDACLFQSTLEGRLRRLQGMYEKEAEQKA